jgi:hypothetical protein
MLSDPDIRLAVPCETHFLSVIRHLVRSSATTAGFSPLEAGEIEVGVDEVAASAASRDLPAQALVISVRITGDALEITLAGPLADAFDRDAVLACVDEIDHGRVPAGAQGQLRLRRFRGPRARPIPR